MLLLNSLEGSILLIYNPTNSVRNSLSIITFEILTNLESKLLIHLLFFSSISDEVEFFNINWKFLFLLYLRQKSMDSGHTGNKI